MNSTHSKILESYANFKHAAFKNRTFTPQEVETEILKLNHNFEVNLLGKSVENRNIYSIKWGKGKIKVFAWSQMHGDEATGTMALFDLFEYLNQNNPDVDYLSNKLELHFIPLVNPDGAHYFTRRNAQKIDINRDFLQGLSPEANILKNYCLQHKPDYGFNLHDQSTLWGIRESRLPATLSFLAPAYNKQLDLGLGRFKAIQIIADIYQQLSPILPGQIGLFDDEFEPRAFGDNFQALGCSTVLIEAGGFPNDEDKQFIRKLYFYALFTGITSIAYENYKAFELADYSKIPLNTKPLFHLLLKDVNMPLVKASIGLNYEEKIHTETREISKFYIIEDIGDLSPWAAYQEISDTDLKLHGEIQIGALANFDLYHGENKLLSFRDGQIVI